MAVKEEKTRIVVTISEDMKNRLDKYADMLGLNRSALCAFLLGQGVLSMDKAYGLLDQTAKLMQSELGRLPLVAQSGEEDSLGGI